MKFKILFSVIFLWFFGEINGRVVNIPPFLKICHLSDPNLNGCIKESVEVLRPYLSKGIPELGIPSCEPLVIPEVVLDEGKGPVCLKSVYRNISVFGPSQFSLRSVRIDPVKNRAKIKLHIPHLHMVSDYKMNGRILMLPISGKGICTGNYTNVNAVITIQGEIIEKEEEKYFNIKDFYVDFDIGHASIELSDLFDGNKQMGDAMNMFLNDNWKCIVKEIEPILEDKLADLFRSFCNKIYHVFPINTLLPP